MTIPTEPIGSIPRPPDLVDADTIARFEATGAPVITDGEQRKVHHFWTYSVYGLPDGRVLKAARVLGAALASEALGVD